MIEFPKDFREFLQLLNSKEVEYLVIGGYAVGYYGYPRATDDLDIWISIRDKNARKMVDALKEFGFDIPELNKEMFLIKEKIVSHECGLWPKNGQSDRKIENVWGRLKENKIPNFRRQNTNLFQMSRLNV